MAGQFVNAILLLLLAVVVSEGKICKDVTCPNTYMPGNYLATNPSDPCSFCQCVWGRPVVMKCANHLGWSEMYSQCIPSPEC